MLFVADNSRDPDVFRSGQCNPSCVGSWRFGAVEENVVRRVQGKVVFGERSCIAVPK